MVHPYLNRRAGREPVRYPHPSLEPILARTLGVPLFQEQLLRMAMVAAGFTGGQAEELRRAFGFKRSERRMKQIEVQLRDGMARQGIAGEAAEQIITSITSFALYGFPESHAASFALLAYASAYLKAHYPGGVLHRAAQQPADGVLSSVDARQGRAAPRRPLSARSTCRCPTGTARSKPDGAIRLGLRYVSGLREQVGNSAICSADAQSAPRPGRRSALSHAIVSRNAAATIRRCSSGRSPAKLVLQQLLARLAPAGALTRAGARSASLDDLIARAGLRRDEVVTLADIGALNSFGYDRRSALWQAERAVRPSGELFTTTIARRSTAEHAEALRR